jgi:cholesterol oxidase
MAMTAHLLGGAVIAVDPTRGVADMNHRVFGYQNLLVCDGAAVPANLGVNPSLTITAMAERAMTAIPAKAAIRKDTTASASRAPDREVTDDTAHHP